MTEHVFVSSPVDVLHGDAARVALETTSDTAHYTEGKGVLSVPLERWQQAQVYERETWLMYGLSLTEDRNAEHAALFDPLAGDYERYHPNCAYRSHMLDGLRVNIVSSTVEQWDEMGAGFRRVRYDTLIMINVLSHCQSVETVFQWINNHLKAGGYLVFHDPARDIDPVQHFDVGHPLSYTQAVIEHFLSGYEQIYRNGDYVIGVKK